jgi:hypothetical protein
LQKPSPLPMDLDSLFETLSLQPTLNVKKCYAMLLQKTNYPYVPLDRVAYISPRGWGNLYIGTSDNLVYVTTDEGDHKYSLECNERLFEYLDLLSCICKTPEELIAQARIPTQDFMFARIAYAYQTIERLDYIFDMPE